MFIWTIQDAIGLIFWGCVLLTFIGVMVLIGLDKLWRGVRKWAKAHTKH